MPFDIPGCVEACANTQLGNLRLCLSSHFQLAQCQGQLEAGD